MHSATKSRQNLVLEKSRLIRALRAVNVCFSRVYHRVEVLTPCPLPRTGRAILVCNHISGLDPALLQSVTPRLVIWMTAQEYFDRPGLRWLFGKVRAIPVKRGEPDLSAMRQALRALSDGHVLGIFPEGRLGDSRRLLEFQTGAALLAIRTDTRIYPAAIEGTQRRSEMLAACLSPQEARVAFGPPTDLSGLDRRHPPVDLITKQVRDAVEGLRQHLMQRPLEKNRNKFYMDG